MDAIAVMPEQTGPATRLICKSGRPAARPAKEFVVEHFRGYRG